MRKELWDILHNENKVSINILNDGDIDIKTPFQMEGMYRIDDTPMHKAVREALVNALTNADYYDRQGVVIIREVNEVSYANPGSIRIGKNQMLRGGISDLRNKTLLKMFNLIDIGERSGSGVPNIFNVWIDAGLEDPEIMEKFNPDRTILRLPLVEKQSAKTVDKNSRQKQSANDRNAANTSVKQNETVGKNNRQKQSENDGNAVTKGEFHGSMYQTNKHFPFYDKGRKISFNA